MTVHSCIVLFLLQYLICIVVDQTHFKWQCFTLFTLLHSFLSSLEFVCQDYKQISIQDTVKFWARQGQPWLMFVVSLVKEIHLFAYLPRDWEEKLTPLSYLCVKYEARVWYLALGKKAKKKASQNIRLCNVQVSLLLYKHDMTGEIHLGIPINDLMWAVALNITWIYLFSVSVFLSLSFLYCPLRICWLWWVNPLISVSPSSSSSSEKKICLFSFQQPGDSFLARRVSYTFPPSAAVLYVNSVLSIPADSLLQISHSLLWMYSPWKPLCNHLCIVFPIVPNPLSPLMTSFF